MTSWKVCEKINPTKKFWFLLTVWPPAKARVTENGIKRWSQRCLSAWQGWTSQVVEFVHNVWCEICCHPTPASWPAKQPNSTDYTGSWYSYPQIKNNMTVHLSYTDTDTKTQEQDNKQEERENERMCAPFIFGMDVCAMLQKVLHHSHTIVTSSKVQWGGMASVHISTVDGMHIGGHQFLHISTHFMLHHKDGGLSLNIGLRNCDRVSKWEAGAKLEWSHLFSISQYKASPLTYPVSFLIGVERTMRNPSGFP